MGWIRRKPFPFMAHFYPRWFSNAKKFVGRILDFAQDFVGVVPQYLAGSLAGVQEPTFTIWIPLLLSAVNSCLLWYGMWMTLRSYVKVLEAFTTIHHHQGYRGLMVGERIPTPSFTRDVPNFIHKAVYDFIFHMFFDALG